MEISSWIIVYFSSVGMVLTGAIIHENIHRIDFQEDYEVEDICYLSLGENVAYTRTSVPASEWKTFEELSRKSERKAYTIQIIFTLIWLVALWFHLNKQMEKKLWKL